MLVAWVLIARSGNAVRSQSAHCPGRSQVDIARLLFHDFLLPFEVTSVLVLIAIMGAVVLASEAASRSQPREEGGLMVPLSYYLVLSGILFACGVHGISDQAQHHHHLHVD